MGFELRKQPDISSSDQSKPNIGVVRMQAETTQKSRADPLVNLGQRHLDESSSATFPPNSEMIPNEAIIRSFRTIEKLKIENNTNSPFTDKDIQSAIKEMHQSSVDYGFIDLKNDQHASILYHYISHVVDCLKKGTLSQERGTGQDVKWQAEKVSSPDVKNTYKTAFLGAGASIAYYIESLGKRFDHSESIIVGMPDPWRDKRGPGVVAHSEHMITPRRQFLEATEIDDVWMDRGKFSQSVEDTFRVSGIEREQRVQGQVKNVKKVDALYHISYLDTNDQQEHIIYAKEVIVGMGAGEHALGPLKEEQVAKSDEEARTKRIMNMDVFTRVADTLVEKDKRTDTTVIVAGGAGGIGAVYDALKMGFRVKWIAGSRKPHEVVSAKPHAAVDLVQLKYQSSIEKDINKKASLDQKIKKLEEGPDLQVVYQGQDKDIFAEDFENFKKIRIDEIKSLRLKCAEKTEDGVVVTATNGKKGTNELEEELKGDYLVYALGQDGNTAKLLDDTIRKDLEPDIDRNFRFCRENNEAEPTVLGLKTADGSLKIIGAAAYKMVNSDQRKSMEPVMRSLPGNVSSSDQLTAIRSMAEARNNAMPYDISKRANFITCDRTMLAVHISAKYPAIADYKLPTSTKGKGTDTVSSDSLVGLLTKMIVYSRRESGIKSKLSGLLPDGPDILPVLPNGNASVFQAFWEDALNKLEKCLQRNKKEE